MPKDYSININDFTGIFRTMAEKANVNGGDTLDNVEISIFSEIEATYNSKSKTFIFDNNYYDENGNIAEPLDKLVEPSVSTGISRKKSPEDLLIEQKNNLAVQNAKDFARQMEQESKKSVRIQKTVNGKNVDFTYNKSLLEDYIINQSKDAKGNRIKYFADIYKIRQKPLMLRTKEESKKLIEFNNMVNNAINAGVEYGVDPKLIIAIMQQEVKFDGLNDNVVGRNGKGYMQITSSPVKDMLGGYIKNKRVYFAENLKVQKYGPELEELLISRGFNTSSPPEEKGALADSIMRYLKENKDPDFNIRLGTLILRNYLYKSNGNIKLAAQNYNGNPKNGIKIAYGRAVKSYYNQMTELHNRV